MICLSIAAIYDPPAADGNPANLPEVFGIKNASYFGYSTSLVLILYDWPPDRRDYLPSSPDYHYRLEFGRLLVCYGLSQYKTDREIERALRTRA